MKQNTLYIASLTMVAALGGLLFGYDTAVISGAEKSIEGYLITSLGLGSFAHGATISSALIGCIIGGIISGFISSKIGRKKSLIIASILFSLSALGSAYPEFLFFTVGEPTVALLLTFNLYRIIRGIGVGFSSAVVSMYICELAPALICVRLVFFILFVIIYSFFVVFFIFCFL